MPEDDLLDFDDLPASPPPAEGRAEGSGSPPGGTGDPLSSQDPSALLSRLEAAEKDLKEMRERPAAAPAVPDPEATARTVREAIAAAIAENERRHPPARPAPEKYPDPPAADPEELANDPRRLVEYIRQSAEYWTKRGRHEADQEYRPRLDQTEQALRAMEHLLPTLQLTVDDQARKIALARKTVPTAEHFDQLLPRALKFIERTDNPWGYRHHPESIVTAVQLVIDREGLPQVTPPAVAEPSAKGESAAAPKGEGKEKRKIDPRGLAYAESVAGRKITKEDYDSYMRMSGRA